MVTDEQRWDSLVAKVDRLSRLRGEDALHMRQRIRKDRAKFELENKHLPGYHRATPLERERVFFKEYMFENPDFEKGVDAILDSEESYEFGRVIGELVEDLEQRKEPGVEELKVEIGEAYQKFCTQNPQFAGSDSADYFKQFYHHLRWSHPYLYSRMQKAFGERLGRLEKEVFHLEKVVEDNKAQKAFLEDLLEWFKKPLSLERPDQSLWHQVLEQMTPGPLFDMFKKLLDDLKPQIFVVEHDWAKAFETATDFAEGSYELPFDMCIFEFKVSGKRLCAVVTKDQGVSHIIAKMNKDWRILSEDAKEMGFTDVLAPLMKLIESQVRAVAIALDANVAVTDVVRAPHKLNKQREKKGKPLLKDYHVVSLNRKSRADRLPSSHEGEPRWKVRLHFRRGHWRHYEDHKTWIKWMLVGDPDLGFIDKHYKL